MLGGLSLVPSPARATAGGEAPDPARLGTFELPSDLVDPASAGGRLQDRRRAPKVHVLLPTGYVDAPDRDYPVLWLLHGANGGTDTWLPDSRGEAAGFPGIVVMPDGGVFGMYMDWWNGGRREGPACASYHLDVLRQTIDDRYNIRPGRRWHAIGGISMGGQGALRYAALLPGYFGSVAALSAAMPDTQAVEFQGGLDLVEIGRASCRERVCKYV